MRRFGRVALVAWAIAAAPAHAQRPGPPGGADSTVVQTIREIVSRAHHSDLKWPDFPYYADEMQGLYGPIGDTPFWFANGKLRPEAREVIDVLLDCGSRGLDPTDYDAAMLDAAWKKLQTTSLPPRDLALFDSGLSLAFLRQISDVHIGRVTPSRVGVELDQNPRKYDLPALVRQAVSTGAIRATVEAAEPQLKIYGRMKAALVRYRAIAAAPPRDVQATGTVRPGDAFGAAETLAARLAAFGDLPSGGAAPPADRYAGALVDAVKRFQTRHGLAPDGVLGPATLAAIDVPPSRRVRQIELALERLRWVPPLDRGPFIVVNIPAFQLWAFDSLNAGGRPALTMPVVVGKALDTRTPIFVGTMQYVVFRPYWNVPYSIVQKELLPELRRDPEALAKRDMEIVAGFDAPEALPVTAENMAKLASGQLRIRQRPGSTNALGPVKFIFPNSANVYLHGTPAQAAFGRSRRDLSHGCVRLEDPAGLAAFVLSDQPEWTADRIRAAMNAPKEQRVDLTRPVQVLLFYTTVVVDLEGQVHFYADIYGNDARLEQELQTAYPWQP